MSQCRAAKLVLFLICLAFGCFSIAQQRAGTTQKSNAIHWLTSLDAGYQQAQITDRPVLVLAISRDDRQCKMVMDTLENCLTRGETDQWVFVCLDVSDSRQAMESLGIATLPAIRLLASSGAIVARCDEKFDAASLARWIQFARHAIKINAATSLDAPNQSESLAKLSSGDVAVRESAGRALAGDRSAAPAVVALLFDGKMTARLAALDLLEQWGAPVKDIDPWNRSTLSTARREKLQAWLASSRKLPTSRPSQLDRTAEIELGAMLAARTSLEADAVREHMVHYGPALLPAIYARLKQTIGDTARQRLTALRYRLVATDRLAGEWPSGFDRLASLDPFVRRGAADELARYANGDDVRLLIELFSDEDAFVRERSLKILRAVGGSQTNQAMMNLLKDPDPNVRAAVLKTLAETPDSSLAPDLIAYISSEKDTDLLVHCIHVLQQIQSDQVMQCFKNLLEHPQWRVRAEACEAIRQMVTNNPNVASETDKLQPIIAALTKHLDDRDEFVVSQAAMALVSFHLPQSNEAVMKALERHPDLVVDLMGELRLDSQLGDLLLPEIRKLVHHASPQMRAMAIRAVCEIASDDAGTELAAGLKDSDSSVRRAAAIGYVDCLQELLEKFVNMQRSPGGRQKWVSEFMAGSGRPAWMADLKPTLIHLLFDSDEQTRVAAAVSLCSLSDELDAWPVLKKSVDSPGAQATEASALPWLGWPRRQELFERLAAATPNGQLKALIGNFTLLDDPRTAPFLWRMLKDSRHDQLLAEIDAALRGSPNIDRTPSITEAKSMLAGGSDLQKTEALCVLATFASNEAGQFAQAMALDQKNGASLRTDALQIFLVITPDEKAEPLAAQSLGDAVLQKTALIYLACGKEPMAAVHQAIRLPYAPPPPPGSVSLFGIFRTGRTRQVHVPAGLQPAALRPLLASSDSDTAGYAGYLLAILGDQSGFVPLADTARAAGLGGSWGKLLYRAIAKQNDDSRTPLLAEIYTAIGPGNNPEMGEFYWTIRVMTGPNSRKLQEKIRNEIGIDNLE